ncbi:MAG: FAD:protein FMN transferase [Rhodothalassiaceae bacterium]|nr:MAG: FAD:protein FMN transferase [Rhodothalassiaceae bacterium]
MIETATGPDPARRRFLKEMLRVAAAGALAGIVGIPPLLRELAAAGRLYHWRGLALGGEAHLWVEAADAEQAAHLVAIALAEKDRLERIFSLYRPDSVLCRLNRAGDLAHPPPELVEVLSLARRVWEASGGAFDVTIQPLYAALASGSADDGSLRRARDRIGMHRVVFDAGRVGFTRPGMALSFNGIAQGYITDRVAAELAAAGCRNALVQFGEVRALGHAPGRAPWPVRVAGLADDALAGAPAIAVTDTAGTRIAGRYQHVLDPRTGAPVAARRALAVAAPSAALADALSTALAVLDPQAASRLLAAFPGSRARRLA